MMGGKSMKPSKQVFSVVSRRIIRPGARLGVLALAGLLIFPVVVTAQQTPAFSGPGWASEEDFKALSKYEFGQERSVLARVEYTVNQVSAGVSGPMDQKMLVNRLCGVLKGKKSTIDARRFACRMLKQLGDVDAVSALAASLKDPQVAPTALWALENIPGTEVDEALRKALGTTRDRVRYGVINALGRRKTAAAMGALAGLLKSGDDLEAARLAAFALADMGTRDARDLLAEAARGADPQRLVVLEPALVRVAESIPDDLFDQWMTLLPDDKVTPATRCARLSLMIARHPERATELLESALGDNDDILTQAALGLLRARPDDASTMLLVRVARKADLTRHPEFIAALADRGAPEAREMALALVDSGNPEASVEAFRTLEKVAVLDDVPVMVRHADGSGPVAQAAFDAVARLTLDGVDEQLVNLASGKGQGTDATARLTALKLIGERKAVGAIPDVVKIAAKADPPVAREALRALQVMARQEDMPELLKLLQRHADSELREDAVRAIVAVCERVPDPARRSEALIDALRRKGKSEKPYALALMEALSQVGQPEGLACLQDMLDRSSGARKAALLDALASWPNGLALDTLRAILVNGSCEGSDREKVLRGYVRLLRAEAAEAPASIVARYRELFEQVVASDQERVLLLSGLAQVVDLGALDLIEEQMTNAAIFDEAANAFVRAARPLFPADPDGVGARLKALSEKNIPDNVRNQIGEILAIADNFQGYICAWQVSGPYEAPGKTADDLFDMPFPPEMEGVDAVWRVAPMAQEYSRPWAILLDRIFGGADRVAYLRTYVWVPADMDAILLLGTNDGCKVWSNGQLVHQFKGGRAFEPDQDQVALHLRNGWNTLLVAVYQYGGAWAASARITSPDGQPVAGLRCSIRPE